MNYEQIRSTTAFLVSELQAHVIKPDELVNFRVLEDSGVITPIGAEESSHLNFTGAIALAPDGRKYRFTRAEIQEAYVKITVEAKPDQATKKNAIKSLYEVGLTKATSQTEVIDPSGGRDRAKKVATKSGHSRISTLKSPPKKK